MQRFFADSFLVSVRMMETVVRTATADLDRPKATAAFSNSVEMCEVYGLTASRISAEKIVKQLSKDECTWELFQTLVSELQERLIDEMSAPRFFELTDQEAGHYSNWSKGWTEIIETFPHATSDVEEMNKSLAFGRYPAAVFHSLMVVEHGLVELGKLLGATDPKEGWDASCKQLAKVVAAGHSANTTGLDFEFLSQLNVCAQAMKLAWRNKVNHATGKPMVMSGGFMPEVAEEIISASRAFMRRLAEGLV